MSVYQLPVYWIDVSMQLALVDPLMQLSKGPNDDLHE